MSKWLAEFDIQNNKQIVNVHEANCANSTNCTGSLNEKSEIPNCTEVLSEKNEILALNERWQKAQHLEQLGFFDKKSPEYQEKVCQQLRQICSRAGDLYDAIVAACPNTKPYLLSLHLFN